MICQLLQRSKVQTLIISARLINPALVDVLEKISAVQLSSLSRHGCERFAIAFAASIVSERNQPLELFGVDQVVELGAEVVRALAIANEILPDLLVAVQRTAYVGD